MSRPGFAATHSPVAKQALGNQRVGLGAATEAVEGQGLARAVDGKRGSR